MDNYSIIDIGTNSMRLLIGTVDQGKIVNREKHLINSRIGAGVDKSGLISSCVLEKNLNYLEQLSKISKERDSKELIVFATSAIRDASNSDEFLDAVRKRLALSVHIIDGKTEAELGFLGVSSQFKGQDMLVFDVGGGSTELTISEGGEIRNSVSIDIGAVRLKEREYELREMRDVIKSSLSHGLLCNSDFTLIGIGGTATTLTSINQKLDEYSPNDVHNSRIEVSELRDIIAMLLSLTDFERKKVVGLNPQRSDIIVPGAIIVEEIMNFYNRDYFIVSDYDNMEGALVYYLKKSSDSIEKYID